MSKFTVGQEVFVIENYDDEGTFSIRRMSIRLLNDVQAVCGSVVGEGLRQVQAYELDSVMFDAKSTDPEAKALELAELFIADRLVAAQKALERSHHDRVRSLAQAKVAFFTFCAKPAFVWA